MRKTTVGKIRRDRELIQENLIRYKALLELLQKECKHSSLSRIPKSDTGNYDRSGDRYWFEYNCSDCGKSWEETQ
jgi:hypothetical protein